MVNFRPHYKIVGLYFFTLIFSSMRNPSGVQAAGQPFYGEPGGSLSEMISSEQ